MKLKLLVLSCFAATQLFAQTESFPCKTDEMHQELFEKYPQYNQGIINAHNRLQEDTKNFIKNGGQKSDATYVIPVVFHIIHNYGPENISDAQIHDALRQVNIQYRKQNSDTSEIVNQFKSIAADIEVEFRLAQLDPDGNCTSGITRTVSPLTSPGNHDVKSLIHWPPHKYLNVYVCRDAAGLAGHAMLPSAADTIPQWDGIVMQHSYVGTIGTSEYFRRTVLSHEIGHFLNLQHIWGGNNVPNYYYLPVADAGNCAFDDDVLDTPNTIGWQSCNLNGTTCGDLDNVQNYMDYAYCGRMFTEGQKQRMHACLNSSVANRNNLWQPENLIATGTDDGTYYLCAAKFESNKRVACVGDTIQFYDLSYHGVQSRSWNFTGGTATSLTDSVTKVVYNTPGKFKVELTAFRNGDEASIEIDDYILILPNESVQHFNLETFENPTNLTLNAIDNNTPFQWNTNTTVGNQSNNSFFIDNFNSTPGVISEFILYPVDVTSLSQAVISFDVAYAQKTTSNNDLLQVYTSTDCGKTWAIRKTLSGVSSLKTADAIANEVFVPADQSEWKNQTAPVNAASMIDDLLVKFRFTSDGGNNVYVDNIQVSHPDQLGINLLDAESLIIYPNPSSETITIESFNEAIEKVELIDLNGKLIHAEQVNASNIQLAIDNIQNGLYFIIVQTKNGVAQRMHEVRR